jgi:hypothetical protein
MFESKRESDLMITVEVDKSRRVTAASSNIPEMAGELSNFDSFLLFFSLLL